MYDYIVIGAGPAGCVAAGRLSEDSNVSVLLFEQGTKDTNPYIHIPATYFKTCKGANLTHYKTTPQAHQNNAVHDMIQGRVLGGGSSVNAMVSIRGIPQDYDDWAKLGCDRWSYKDVLPYFKLAENNDTFSGEAHGVSGPAHTSAQRATHYLTKAWVKACQEYGIPFNPDFNSGHQAGAGYYQVAMKDGRRCSAAAAYLTPARGRTNLEIKTDTKVTRVLIENKRAIGVEYVEDGVTKTARAKKEVIVSAGAIGSPHLLMLSGIGPADELKEVGVAVKHDLPGVGKNLQDHMDVFLIYDLNGPHSYDKYKKLHWQVPAGAQYLMFRDGPAASNICEGALFWHADAEDPEPNLQYHFLPGAGVEQGTDTAPSGNGCTINICQTRPRSVGTVKLASSNPDVHPNIDPNYLSDPYDLACLTEGVRLAEQVMTQPSISKYVNRICRPSANFSSQEARADFVRSTAQGALHPAGTCKMGNDDMAVVDQELRVHGITGLRVADTSIMPRLVSGNTTAPAVMIGERLADFIRSSSN
jgi:choline dehydrogenase